MKGNFGRACSLTEFVLAGYPFTPAFAFGRYTVVYPIASLKEVIALKRNVHVKSYF